MLLIAHVARQTGMKILLRIDDIDAARKRSDYVEDIFHTLDWLQIPIDIGPSSPDEFEQNWSQHHRLPLYEQTLHSLAASGRVYGCPHSRAEIAAASTDGQYPLALRAGAMPLSQPETPWRLRTESGEPGTTTAFRPQQPFDLQQIEIQDVFATMRDFVVRRRDGLPAYQICSIADDAHFGVTHVIRGADLLPSTAAQTVLQRLLKLPETACWHHPLIWGPDGQKLSKSAGAEALNTSKTPALKAWLEAKVTEILA